MVTSALRSPLWSEGAHRGSSQPAVRGGGAEQSKGRGEEGHLQHPRGPPRQYLRARRCERRRGSNRPPLKQPPVTQMGKNTTRRNHPWKPFFSVPRGRAGKTLTKGVRRPSSRTKGRGCSAGSVLCPVNRCRAGRGSPPLAEPPKFTQPSDDRSRDQPLQRGTTGLVTTNLSVASDKHHPPSRRCLGEVLTGADTFFFCCSAGSPLPVAQSRCEMSPPGPGTCGQLDHLHYRAPGPPWPAPAGDPSCYPSLPPWNAW